MGGQASKQERQALLEKVIHGDKVAREAFIELNLPLVWSMVQRFLSRGYEAEDLFQVGSMGLVKAMDKFDLSFGVQFSTYAVPMIIGEIKRYIRDDGMVKVSRSLKELAMHAKMTAELLRKEMGAEPTTSQIAERLSVAAEDVTMALSAAKPHESLSGSVICGEHQDVTLMDTICDETNMEEDTINRLTIKGLLQKLSPREQMIVTMRYFEHKTQVKIAGKLGVSQVQVSRLEKKVLQTLRYELCGRALKNQTETTN